MFIVSDDPDHACSSPAVYEQHMPNSLTGKAFFKFAGSTRLPALASLSHNLSLLFGHRFLDLLVYMYCNIAILQDAEQCIGGSFTAAVGLTGNGMLCCAGHLSGTAYGTQSQSVVLTMAGMLAKSDQMPALQV